jgi:hypothetical protein
MIANCNDEIQKTAFVPKQGKKQRGFCVWHIKKLSTKRLFCFVFLFFLY